MLTSCQAKIRLKCLEKAFGLCYSCKKRKHTILYKKTLTMAIKTFRLYVSTTAEIDIIDTTSKLEPIAEQAGTGALLLFVPGQRLR